MRVFRCVHSPSSSFGFSSSALILFYFRLHTFQAPLLLARSFCYQMECRSYSTYLARSIVYFTECDVSDTTGRMLRTDRHSVACHAQLPSALSTDGSLATSLPLASSLISPSRDRERESERDRERARERARDRATERASNSARGERGRGILLTIKK
jgi:hypothetical protein